MLARCDGIIQILRPAFGMRSYQSLGGWTGNNLSISWCEGSRTPNPIAILYRCWWKDWFHAEALPWTPRYPHGTGPSVSELLSSPTVHILKAWRQIILRRDLGRFELENQPSKWEHTSRLSMGLGYTPEQIYDLFFPLNFRFICNPNRPSVCGRFGLPSDRLWRFEFVVQKGEDGDEMARLEMIKKVVFPYITHPGRRYG